MNTIRDPDKYRLQVFYACPKCGWWTYVARYFPNGPESTVVQVRGAAASLKEFDLADVSLPLSEVRSYLLASYESRFSMHPRLFEETVGSVFRDLGYKIEVTGYGNDGGIDVILRSSNEIIGVQVKRYRNKIKVEQIRSLAGALILRDLTKGIFVTTSSFTAGASGASQLYGPRGVSIRLYDSKRFLEALNLTQRKPYKNFSDLPTYDGKLFLNFSTVIEEFERVELKTGDFEMDQF